MLKNSDRETIIRNAIRDYKHARRGGTQQQIETAINGMENTFAAVCLWAAKGTEELRQTILEARGRVL